MNEARAEPLFHPTTEEVIDDCFVRRMNKNPNYVRYYTNQAKRQRMITAKDSRLDPIVAAIYYFGFPGQGFKEFTRHFTAVSNLVLKDMLSKHHDMRQTYKLCWPVVCNMILEKVELVVKHFYPMARNRDRASRILKWLVSYFDSVVLSCEENMEGLTINEWIEKQGGWNDLLNYVGKKESCICQLPETHYLSTNEVECNYCANLCRL